MPCTATEADRQYNIALVVMANEETIWRSRYIVETEFKEGLVVIILLSGTITPDFVDRCPRTIVAIRRSASGPTSSSAFNKRVGSSVIVWGGVKACEYNASHCTEGIDLPIQFVARSAIFRHCGTLRGNSGRKRFGIHHGGSLCRVVCVFMGAKGRGAKRQPRRGGKAITDMATEILGIANFRASCTSGAGFE